MYQAVKPIVPSGAHTLTHSEIKQESPSVKMDDKKYLPCAVEHTGNYFGTDLSSRCIFPVMTEKDNDDFYVHLAKDIVFTLDRTYFDSIDEVSWRNIADSLKFSGIDTLEKATAMDLKVCPPCPVFHTWAALHGTTIFDGKNNPQRLSGLNYVERILKEGTELSKNDIPLFIVFSDKALKESQINEMKASFKDHDNILCISLEKDLQLKFPKELECRTNSYMGFVFMDCIRVVVSQHITETINFCIDKAKSENKTNLANRLEKLGTNFLFYSDIDNQWLSKPPYILASHGMFTQPKLSEALPLFGIRDSDRDKLSNDDQLILTRHRSFFSDFPYRNTSRTITWSSDKAKKLFDYILSGEAESNFKHLSSQIVHISSHYKYLLRNDKGVSWTGENSCFFVADHSKDVFLKGASKIVTHIDLHQKPDGKCANPDPYYREAHSLVGMQLLKYYSHGHDFTWM